MRRSESGGLDSDEPYAKAMLLAENVILDLENCASDFSAIAQFRLVNAKGSWYEIDDWVYRIDRYNKDRKRVALELEDARKKEQATAAVIGLLVLLGAAAAAANSSGGGYVNPNQHWVNGYFRQDGTYVPGHWRTNPNNVCWDNINGCP